MPDIFINTERPIDRSIVAGINQPQREALKQSYVAGSSYDVNLYFVKNDGTYDSRSGGARTDVQFAISTISEPKSGTFTLTDGTDTTAEIEYGASAKDVQDALNALNSDTGPNTGTASLVDVDKRNDGQYTITWRELGTMTALSGASVSLFPESSPTASVAISGSSTEYAQQVVEIVRQPAIFRQSWAEITNGHSATVALDSTRLLQSLVVDQGKPFFIEVKLDGETVAKEVITVEESTMPASAYSGRVIQSILDDFATNPGSNAYFSASAWRTALSINNVDNTSDASKPISTATQAALDDKASSSSLTSHTSDTANPHSVTATQVGLGSVDNTADADKPVSTAQQAALDAKSDLENRRLTIRESAGMIPFRLPADISPYTDPDADAVITATSTTDDRARLHYQRIVKLLKGMGIWSDLDDAYLMGSNWQSSSTTLQSITGNNTASGTGTQSGYYTTFNGTTNKYLFLNTNAGTALTAKTFIAIYKSAGAQAVQGLVSSYQGGSTRGPQLSVGGAAIGGSSGPSTIDNIYALGCISDGSTNTTITVDKASDEKWSFAGFSYGGGTLSLFGNSRNPTRASLAELWNNNTNIAIGANSNSSHFFDGDMIFAAVFDAGLTDYQMFSLRLGLESILFDAIDFPDSILFDGNSLTRSAAGGGTNWPTQLLTEAGWSDIERNANIALDGARQTQEIEQEYFTQARQWLGMAGQDNLYFLWSGINDITASIATQDIIDSLKRHVMRAKAEGFRVVLLTLTPVADDGDGTTYTYSAAQQTSLTDVNTWIRGEGSNLADQVVDLDEIGDTFAEFLDPTDSTYYVSGDGLHHNDAGRGLIADKINAEVTPPSN